MMKGEDASKANPATVISVSLADINIGTAKPSSTATNKTAIKLI